MKCLDQGIQKLEPNRRDRQIQTDATKRITKSHSRLVIIRVQCNTNQYSERRFTTSPGAQSVIHALKYNALARSIKPSQVVIKITIRSQFALIVITQNVPALGIARKFSWVPRVTARLGLTLSQGWRTLDNHQ